MHSKHGAFKTFPSVFLLFLALPPKPRLVLQVRVQDLLVDTEFGCSALSALPAGPKDSQNRVGFGKFGA